MADVHYLFGRYFHLQYESFTCPPVNFIKADIIFSSFCIPRVLTSGAEHKANEEQNVHVVFKYLSFACWLQFRLCLTLKDPRFFYVVPPSLCPPPPPLTGNGSLYLLQRERKD
jgi:hypothetical protein